MAVAVGVSDVCLHPQYVQPGLFLEVLLKKDPAQDTVTPY